MAKASPIQNNFNGGELSPLLYGRTDIDKYRTGMAVCKNAVTLIQGPWLRRSGTKYVAEVKDSTKTTRAVGFEFSTTQAYIIEFGDLYLRFYMDRAQILDAGSPYEIVTPYAEADINSLKFVQSTDTLYIFHENYKPAKLTRTGHTNWTLTDLDFQDGPYLLENITPTTFNSSLATGSVTVTVSSIVGINNGTGMQPGDVGRVFRIENGSGGWGWGKITAVNNTLEFEGDIIEGSVATSATGKWRLGVWSDTAGHPSVGTFVEDRLVLAGSSEAPQRVDGSRSSRYENFAPTELDSSVLDDNEISFTLNASQVNRIQWLVVAEQAMLVGTVGAEWVVRPSSLGEALTPSNVVARVSSTNGSSSAQAIRVGAATIFIQNSTRKVRDIRYKGIDTDGFDARDLSIMSEHMTVGGISNLVYQRDPQSILWARRNDGRLLGLTYDENNQVTGWHLHELGGFSDAAKTVHAKFKSEAVIPTPDGLSDEVWVIAERNINGVAKQYVEFLMPFWEKGNAQEDAFFVDCGLTYDGVPATTISGLDHLEGETVQVLADGAVQPDVTVSGGSVTIDRPASKIHFGFQYVSDGKILRLEAGASDGTAQGKTKVINSVVFRLYDSLGLEYGPELTDTMDEYFFRKAGDPTNTAVPLFNGDIKIETWPGDADTKGQIAWRQSAPLPLCVQALMPQVRTEDE